MGKRGPRPKGEYGGKIGRTAVFSTRMQVDTRARLAAAAKAGKRSLSQEVEYRLRRTFIEDDTDARNFGSEQTGAVVRLLGATIAAAIAKISARGKGGHDWLAEPWAFDDVKDAIDHMLLWLRPGGESGMREIKLSSGTDVTDQLIEEIRTADPSLPITKGSTQQHARAMLKAKLGSLADPPHPYDEWSKKEPPIKVVAARLDLPRVEPKKPIRKRRKNK